MELKKKRRKKKKTKELFFKKKMREEKNKIRYKLYMYMLLTEKKKMKIG